MKFLGPSVLMAVAVASATLSVAHAHAHVPGSRVAFETGLLMESEEALNLETPSGHLRRALESGSGGGSTAPPPTTARPPVTTPPPPVTTPPPTTTAPPPTTAAPPPPTDAPTTAPPVTTTAAPVTTAPATTAPKPTEKKDDATKAPAPTTAGPTTSGPATTAPPAATVATADPAGSASSGSPKATPSAKVSKPTDNSQDGSTKSEPKKMSTGTIIGIVGGIVVGVGILAVIAVVLARKRREEDDDPLSPFELSMDKGYNGAGASGYGGQQQQPTQQGHNPYNTQPQYGAARTGTTNNAAAIGAGAAVGAAAGVGAGVMLTTDTPSASADAAGVAYTQFYDPVTSPDSMYPPGQSKQTFGTELTNSGRTDPSNNGTNLWMSAMEPKENDVEGGALGASVPPEVLIPGDNSSFASRNSYDVPVGASIDIDQSSVLSGSSDLDKDFPDYEDGSSRGSYEL